MTPKESVNHKLVRYDFQAKKPHYSNSNTLEKKGEVNGANAGYQKAIELTPHWEEVRQSLTKVENKFQENNINNRLTILHYKLGKILAERREWDEAIACYRKAIEVDPNFVDVYQSLGDSLVERGEKEEAIRVYQRAIEIEPLLWEVHHKLGNLLQEIGQFDEAVGAYQKSIELKSDFCWSYHNLGDVLVKLEKWEEAAGAYRRVVELNPNFAWGHYKLGDVLVELEDWEGAIASYRQGVAINPQAPWSLYKLGELLRQQGKFEEAARYFRQAVEIKADVAEFYFGLGATLANLGQWSEAEDCLKRLIQPSYDWNSDRDSSQMWDATSLFNPNLADAYYYLGVAKSGQEQWSEAAEWYRQSLDLNPGKGDCCFALAEALGKLWQWSEAVECYRLGVLLAGKSGEVSFRLGQALGQLQRWQEAVTEYQIAIDLGCDRAEAHHLMGYALSQLGRWQKAVAEFQKSLELVPDSALVWQHLGDALLELEQKERAVEAYKKALEFKPGWVETNRRLASLLVKDSDRTSALTVASEKVAAPSKSLEKLSPVELKQRNKAVLATLEKSTLLQKSQEKIRAFHNKHRGDRCVIIGNGPSLNQMDLSFLKDEICFGTNKIYLGFDRWDFSPTYYVAVNPLVIEQSADAIEKMSCPKFIDSRGVSCFSSYPDELIFVQTQFYGDERFSKNPDLGLCEGYTVTYVAMQLAYYMGFEEVILIGVDHHFVTQGKAGEVVISEGDDANHFDANYFGQGLKWQLPDLVNSQKSYKLAKQVFEESGRRIVDATVNGRCQVFPKQDYQEIFKKHENNALTKNLLNSEIVLKDYYNQGNKLLVQKKYKEAVKLYQQAIDMQPNNFKLYYGLGKALTGLESWEQSISAYQKALEINPDLADANKALSEALINQSKLEEEEKKLVEQHPFSHPIFLPTSKLPIQDRVKGLKKVLGIYNERYNSVYLQKLLELKEKFKNRDRAFIIGNGPSLNYTDLELLKEEVTFGVNGIFFKSKESGWKPTFYVVEDHLVAEDRQDAINSYEGPIKLFPISLAYCLDENPNTIFFNHRPRISYPNGYDFSTDASLCTYTGCTVTYTCIQLAYFLGFKNVYLIGVDASYAIPEDVKVDNSYKTETLDMKSDDINHFHPDYFGKGYRWHDPQVGKMKEAYKEARRVCNQNNKNIFNATIGGKLEVFPRVDYYSLFNHNRVSPRLLIIDMTKVGSLSATGQVKKNLLADWSKGNWLQVYTEGEELKLFSEADLVSNQDETKIVEECCSFNPQVIYYRPVADKPLLHKIACKLIEKIGCSVVVHIMDDWLERLSYRNYELYLKLEKSTRILIEKSAARLSISEAMSAEFQNRYGLDFIPISNCVHPQDWIDLHQKNENYKLEKSERSFIVRYIGGLADDMSFSSICDIVSCIVNIGQELDITLEIYTQELYLQKAANQFSNLQNVKIYESNFSEEKYRELLCSADALIIAYNFDEDSIRYVKYSMANKLPECLASGTPVLAYGPMEVATIEYAAQTEVVQIVSDKSIEKLSLAIRNLVTNPDMYQNLGKKAQKFAFEYHNSQTIRHKFESILRKAAFTPQAVTNLLSSMLDFELVSGIPRSDKTRINSTDFVLEFFQENSQFSIAIDVNDRQVNVLDEFAKRGWKTLNCNSKTFISEERLEEIRGTISENLSVNSKTISSLQDLTKICERDNLKKIDFLKIDTEGYDFIVLQGFPWNRLPVSVIECNFDDNQTVPLGYTFHDLAQYLVENGYTVVVNEWHPKIKSRRKHDWYRLSQYPCELASNQSWGNIIALKTGIDWQSILDIAKKVVKREPLETRNAKSHIERGNTLEKEGKIEEAIQEIEIALDINPEKMELHYKMGELLLKQKRFKEAMNYYQNTIEIKPDYFWALRGLGDALKEQGQFEEALTFYRQVIELNPSYFYGYDKIARVLQMQGKLSEAIAYFRKALEIKPDSPTTLKALKECLSKQQ